VMVDVDEQPSSGIEPAQTRTLDAITFEDERGTIGSIDRTTLLHGFDERQWLVDLRYRVAQYGIRVLAESAQHLRRSEHRADRVTVRTRVRSHDKVIVLADRMENGVEHG
jgi:hypothetical protein